MLLTQATDFSNASMLLLRHYLLSLYFVKTALNVVFPAEDADAYELFDEMTSFESIFCSIRLFALQIS